MSEYRKATKRIEVSTGDSDRILRELQELSQNLLHNHKSMKPPAQTLNQEEYKCFNN